MYYCFRCGKETKTKSNLNSHLRNRKQCLIKFMDISRDDIINNYNDYLNKFISLYPNNPNVSGSSIQKRIEKIVCEYCQRSFTHKNNYYRHKKERCKIIKHHKIMDEFLNTKYNLLKLEYEEKLKVDTEKIEKIEEKLEKEIKNKNKIKEELENKIKILETKLVPITNTQQINNGYIGDNTGHIGDNITNITINNFGEEKINMSVKDCERIMSYEFDMIVKLIEYIHIIPPENRNAFIPSLKEKYAMIMRNQKWDLVDRKEFIDNLIINKNIMLEQLLEEYGSRFQSVNPNRSKSVIHYCKTDNEEYDRRKTNTNLLLYNNKHLVKDTFETSYSKKINGI